jgi:hypothetical protein
VLFTENWVGEKGILGVRRIQLVSQLEGANKKKEKSAYFT